MRDMSCVSTKANWIIWCLENEKDFTMIGSRKVNQLDMEINYDSYWNDLDIFSLSASGGVSHPRSYSLTGTLAGFTMVIARTEFEAFITLMHTFQEEERKEREITEAYTARIKEEKKLRKAHKKNKKAALEGKFDHAKCLEDCPYCIEEDEPYGVDEYDGDFYRYDDGLLY